MLLKVLSPVWNIGFLLLTLTIAGQSLSSKNSYVKEKSYYQEIHFEYVKGKIVLPVILEGKTYRFILDTGAPTILSTQLAEELGIAAVDTLKVSDANETKQPMALVRIPKLSLANLHFYNSSALLYTVKTNDIFDCFQVDGFIGSNLLNHSILQINHDTKKIILTDAITKVAVNPKTKTKLKLVGSQKSPYLLITLGDRIKNQVLLDTGMEGSYDMALRTHKTFGKRGFYKPVGKGNGAAGIGLFGTGERTTHYRTVISKIKLGKTTFKNVLAETTTDSNSRIGSSFFEQGTSTFDFTKKRFYFEPYADNPDLTEWVLGFSPTLQDNKLIVGIVWENDLAKKIRSGDEILSVNGRIIQNLTICDLFVKPSIFKTKDTILLKVKKSDGAIVEINLARYAAD